MARKKTKRRLEREAQVRLMVGLNMGADKAEGLTLTKEQVQKKAQLSRSKRSQSQLIDARKWVNHTDNGKCDKLVIDAKLGFRRATVFEGERLSSDNVTKLAHDECREQMKVTLGAPVNSKNGKITLQQFNVIKSCQDANGVIDYNQLMTL